MRRLASSLAATLLVTALAPVAIAQTPPPGQASVVLIRQSPWNSPEQPLLRLGVRARNDSGAPMGDLSMGITVFSPVRSRTAYTESLTQDPVDVPHLEQVLPIRAVDDGHVVPPEVLAGESPRRLERLVDAAGG